MFQRILKLGSIVLLDATQLAFARDVVILFARNGWMAKRHQPQLRRADDPLADFGEDKEESIPDVPDDDDDDCLRAFLASVGPHPWGGPVGGDDEDYDFLRRDEWREEAQFRNDELRRRSFGRVLCGAPRFTLPLS